MKNGTKLGALLGTLCVVALNGVTLSAQEKAAPSAAEVHVVITDTAVRSDSELPRLRQDEVKVKQGKTFLQVTQLIPAQGENAAVQLMILIDDTLDPGIGGNLNDLKEFIKAQPSSAVIGIGYMSNAGVNVVQNFTAARSYNQMTDEKADELIQKSLSYQKERAELLAQTDNKVKQALGAITAARFAQVEHQLLLIIDLQIASSLPVVE